MYEAFAINLIIQKGDAFLNKYLLNINFFLNLVPLDPNPTLELIIAKVRRQQAYILNFVEHEGAPNHNNYGEYIIKKGILKRKVSGGSTSGQGFMAYAILQSIAQTCHLRGLSFRDFLMKSLVCYIRTGTPLLLKQYEETQSSTSPISSTLLQKEAA